MASAFSRFDLVCRIYSLLQVSQIIQAVKNTNDINTIGNRLLHETVNHIVRVRSVAEDILSSEQHLQFCIFKTVSQFTKSLPGIFLQKSERCIESRAAPALHRVIADFIHGFHDGKHQIGRHSRSDQRLVGITKYCFGNSNRFFNLF